MLAFSIMGSAAMADKLKIEVMQEGNGDVAEHGQRVTVHYEGRLIDDTVFDASSPEGSRLASSLGEAGHPRMGTRCRWHESWRNATFDHPGRPWLWRAGADGVIPPSATLVFDIELLAVSMPVSLAGNLGRINTGAKRWRNYIDIRRAQMNGRKQVSLRGLKPLPHSRPTVVYILIFSNNS